jgi:hypothetical protein
MIFKFFGKLIIIGFIFMLLSGIFSIPSKIIHRDLVDKYKIEVWLKDDSVFYGYATKEAYENYLYDDKDLVLLNRTVPFEDIFVAQQDYNPYGNKEVNMP